MNKNDICLIPCTHDFREWGTSSIHMTVYSRTYPIANRKCNGLLCDATTGRHPDFLLLSDGGQKNETVFDCSGVRNAPQGSNSSGFSKSAVCHPSDMDNFKTPASWMIKSWPTHSSQVETFHLGEILALSRRTSEIRIPEDWRSLVNTCTLSH